MKRIIYLALAVTGVLTAVFLVGRGKYTTDLPQGSPSATQAVFDLKLIVSSPQDNQVVTDPSLIVTGSTAPGAEVFVDDKEVVANARGEFSVTINLDEGENIIVVSANDSSGNYKEMELIVTYEPSE